METMGEKIRRLRTEKKLSQEELGEKIGVQKAAIYKYENSLVVNLKRSTIDKLANALDVPPAYLMGWGDGTAETQPIHEASDDRLIALYGKVKAHLSEEDIEDIAIFMEVKARRKKEKEGN